MAVVCSALEGYAGERRALINPRDRRRDRNFGRAGCRFGYGLSERGGWRGQCRLVHQQQYMSFGQASCRRKGIFLQNRGHNSASSRSTPTSWRRENALITRLSRRWLTRGGPRAARIVYLLWRDGRLYAAARTFAGDRCSARRRSGSAGGAGPASLLSFRWRGRAALVALEEEISVVTMDALAEMGHQVYSDERLRTGGIRTRPGYTLKRDAVSSVLCAGSDPRADGCAVCL